MDPTKIYIQSTNEIPEEFLKDENYFQSLVEVEETLVRELYYASIPDTNNGNAYESLLEELDIAKAYLTMKESAMDPLPEHLVRYTELNLEKPEKESSIVIRLTQKGIQFIDTLTQGLGIRQIPQLSPTMRSPIGTKKEQEPSGYALLEEKISDDLTIYYQFIQESPGVLFLSIQLGPHSQSSHLRQVILKRNGRFILSSHLNEDGFVNFSGLNEGNYSLEFLTPTNRKVVDLCLLNG